MWQSETAMNTEIRQGQVWWLDMGVPFGSEPGYRRPFVVVQNNLFNRSRLQTVVMCAVTTNLRLADAPGNVLLAAGEAQLREPGVVNVSQLVTVDRRRLVQKIGELPEPRVQTVLDGLNLLLNPRGG